MLLALKPHPDNPPDGVEHIEVDVLRDNPHSLVLTWRLTGDMDRIVLPAFQERARRHELWKHSCFELFIQGDGDSYYEFNFSPSGGWAVYRLMTYRDKQMADAPGVPTPGHQFKAESAALGLVASVNLAGLPGLALYAPLRIGLSAIVEGPAGQRSFWALAHAPGEPDFHNPVAFAGEIPTMDYA